MDQEMVSKAVVDMLLQQMSMLQATITTMQATIDRLTMGHSEIGVTLNTYTHLGFEDTQAELSRINMPGSSKDKMFKKQA